MATKRKATKRKTTKRKTTPCSKCKPFSVTPSRNAKGQFKKRKK